MKNKKEIRTFAAHELRVAPAAADGTRTLSGTAIVFNQRSRDMGFREIISPKAVVKTLRSGNNVLLLSNHDVAQPLGSTQSRTLQLSTDANGVNFSCRVDPRISYVNDMVLSVERGVTGGCSFGFRALKDSWSEDNGVAIRMVEELELFELTLTAAPCYEQTTTSVRSCPPELRSLLNGLDDDDDENEACDDPDCPFCAIGDYANCPNKENRTWLLQTMLQIEVAKRR